MRAPIGSAVTLLLFSVFAGAQSSSTRFVISPNTRDVIRQLIGDCILDGKAYEYADPADIGPRLTGSANYMRAAEGTERVLKQLGLANVHTQEWTIPATWEPDSPAISYLLLLTLVLTDICP